MTPPPGVPVLTVAELNEAARTVVEGEFGTVWVTGEISNLKRPGSGHIYFTLKDAGAEVAGVIWRSTAIRLKFEPANGLAVIVRGSVTIYQQRGTFQVVCAELYPQGEGALDLALRQLREKLFARGWFERERKKPLPRFPKRVAVVTSQSGAAVRDILETLIRRWPAIEIVVIGVKVQGDGAAEEIAEAIDLLGRLHLSDKLPVETVIVGRGGGSLEDLWAFNEEAVARAIFESAIPIISGVGHEIDVTIADLVADHRALTPTNAAEVAVPDRTEMLGTLQDLAGRLAAGPTRVLQMARRRLEDLAERRVLRLPLERVRERAQRLDDVAARLHRAGRRRVQRSGEAVAAAAGRLHSLSPLNILARGYSVTQSESGELIRDAGRVRPGDRIRTRLNRGRILSRVEAMEFDPERDNA